MPLGVAGQSQRRILGRALNGGDGIGRVAALRYKNQERPLAHNAAKPRRRCDIHRQVQCPLHKGGRCRCRIAGGTAGHKDQPVRLGLLQGFRKRSRNPCAVRQHFAKHGRLFQNISHHCFHGKFTPSSSYSFFSAIAYRYQLAWGIHCSAQRQLSSTSAVGSLTNSIPASSWVLLVMPFTMPPGQFRKS